MKRIATLAIILLMGLTASASSIRYFTESQAVRTVRYLNAQNEMMIYCGYEYELETYVLINEVWMERVNSAYYEIWVFGFDAYTGDEIYMPLDLGCVWLFSGGRIYNAAQYLRFHATVRTPNITWYVPQYNPFTRMIHRPGYVRSYHYDIHRYGWMPPAYHYGPGVPPPPLPPYYMRHPNPPAPRPNNTWTPGYDRPVITAPSAEGRTGSSGRVTTGAHSSPASSGTRTGNATNSRGTGEATGSTSSRSTGTAAGSTSGRSTGTASGSTSSRNTGSATGSSSGRSTSSTGTSSSRGTGTTAGTSTSGSSRTSGTTPTRTNTRATSSSTRTGNSEAAEAPSTDKPKATTTRSTGTATRGTGTTTRSTSTTTRGTGTATRGTGSTRSNINSR